MRVFLSLAMLLSLACSSYAESGTEELKNLLMPVSNLQATFQQTVKSEQGRVLQNSSGKVSLKKPGQFRWEVLGKEPRLIVSDGQKVWDFDRDLDQVTVQKLNKGQIRAPIFFLTGDVNTLEKDFKIIKLPLKKDQCLTSSDVCFELIPKREEGSFQWIRIGFYAGTIKEMELLDQLGQYSQLIFKNIKLNQSIPSNQFQFKPPAGIDVLENN